ncbi:Reverse transcriptase/retrotransposon-derived protein, RNase H-like domain [Dillenia turbinata]|uniref:Reverse transcriptase/retrotransposon-derived protein, RNase H-like domain n=1 Tax=Dillenia turbinata TaxID=194707 RepID=A0AAN8VUF9_9MAGN
MRHVARAKFGEIIERVRRSSSKINQGKVKNNQGLKSRSKDGPWEWTIRYKEAFKALKEVVASKLVLRLFNFTLPFEMHTDASDRAIGGVLVQEGHSVAFESRKLKEAE